MNAKTVLVRMVVRVLINQETMNANVTGDIKGDTAKAASRYLHCFSLIIIFIVVITIMYPSVPSAPARVPRVFDKRIAPPRWEFDTKAPEKQRERRPSCVGWTWFTKRLS